MVTLADDDSTTIRFVNLAADEIERLKRTTGGSYTIYPTQSAEVRTVEAIAPSGASFHQKHICLRGTDREGQILEARVVRVGARDAEVRGSFALGGSRVVVSYKLRLTGGRWAVTASKNVFAT
jgi:hypothetical protein